MLLLAASNRGSGIGLRHANRQQTIRKRRNAPRERVKTLDGEFLISSSLGISATIQIVLPLNTKEGTK